MNNKLYLIVRIWFDNQCSKKNKLFDVLANIQRNALYILSFLTQNISSISVLAIFLIKLRIKPFFWYASHMHWCWIRSADFFCGKVTKNTVKNDWILTYNFNRALSRITLISLLKLHIMYTLFMFLDCLKKCIIDGMQF